MLEDFLPLTSDPATPGTGDIVYEYWASTAGLGQVKAVYGRHGVRDDFAYDWRGRLASKTRDYAGSMQFAFGYTYDRQDRPTMTVLPDASSISYVYDGAQLSQAYSVLWYAGGGFAVDAAVYGLDSHPSGGLTSLTFLSPAFGSQPAVQSIYSYGAGDQRLASATTVRNPFGAPEVIQQLLYTYDTAGNLRRSDDALNEIDQDFAYDLFHRLAEVDTLGTLSYGSETYEYDAAGNLTYKGPAETAGQLRLRYDRTASQPTHLASVDVRPVGGSWLTGFGSYAIDNDGGVTQRTKDSQLTTFWRNDAGQAQMVGIPAAWQTATHVPDADHARYTCVASSRTGTHVRRWRNIRLDRSSRSSSDLLGSQMRLRTSRNRLFRSLLAGLLAVTGCIMGSDPSGAQIEYRVAVIEGDSMGPSSPKCKVETDQRVAYRYPSGRQVAVQTSKDPALTVALDGSVDVRLLDFRSARSRGMQVVVAEVTPPAAVLKRAIDVRHSLLQCDLLITLNGEAVSIERRGTDWSQRLPGGRFPSMEAADRAYSKQGASVRHDVPSAADLQVQDDYWERRRQKDLWDFHCDATTREMIRTKNPTLYEALAQTPAPDCQSPPIMPEADHAVDDE